MSISTSTGRRTPNGARRLVEVPDVLGIVDARHDLGLPREAHRRAIFRAPTTSFDTRTFRTPPETIASASLTFWQQDPTAPRAIWWRATTGHLCVFAWPRRRTGVPASEAAIRSRLRS